MKEATKVCSRCKKDKYLSEFYRQKDRYESLCKVCKKEARVNREKGFEAKSSQSDNNFQNLGIPTKLPSTEKSSERTLLYDFEIESMPEIDESIFYPERKIMDLGLSKDDVAELSGFLRWQLEQKDKRFKNKLEEGL